MVKKTPTTTTSRTLRVRTSAKDAQQILKEINSWKASKRAKKQARKESRVSR